MKEFFNRAIHRLCFVSLAFTVSFVASGYQSDLKDRTNAQPMRFIEPQDMGITLDTLDAVGMNAWLKQPSAVSANIAVDTGIYDPKILTKFIPASAFIPYNLPGGVHDGFIYDNAKCIRPSVQSGGFTSEGFAPVELPDNALLLDAVIWAYDNHSSPIYFWLVADVQWFWWTQVGEALIPHFADSALSLGFGQTTGTPGWGGYVLEVDPDEVTGLTVVPGGPPPYGIIIKRKFITLEVSISNDGGDDIIVCGAEVHYKVPATGSNQVLTPLTPCRFFDSRPNNGGTGKFSANETRTVWTTGDSTSQGGVGNCGVPSSATALQVSFVVIEPDGTGSLKLWAPNVAEPQGVLAYTSSPTFWNGSGVVPIAAEPGEQTGQPRLRIKTNGSGAHLYLAVTGYYSAVSNMGN